MNFIVGEPDPDAGPYSEWDGVEDQFPSVIASESKPKMKSRMHRNYRGPSLRLPFRYGHDIESTLLEDETLSSSHIEEFRRDRFLDAAQVIGGATLALNDH